MAETASPWKPTETAPKDGRPFIAYDQHIQLVKEAHCDKEERKFLNEVGLSGPPSPVAPCSGSPP